MRLFFKLHLTFLILAFCGGLFAYPNNNGGTGSVINNAFGSCGGVIAAPVDCATGCHTPPGGFSPVITVAGPSPVEPGLSGTYTISSSDGNAAGFNLKVVNDADAVIGLLSETDPNALLEINVLGQSIIRHIQPTISRSWNYTWQAPPGSGTFNMCYCVNSVNGDADGLEFNVGVNGGTGLGGDNPVCGVRRITVNEKPEAVDDAISIDEDSSISFNVLTLLNNLGQVDSDTEGDTLSVASYSNDTGKPGLNCSVTGTTPSCSMSTNPATYDSLDDDEPPAVVTFNYSLSDTNWPNADTGTVTITINGVNDAPVAVNDSIAVTIGGTATSLLGGNTSVLTNDTDVDANEAVKTALLEPGGNVQFGTLTLNSNGTFIYTHDGSNNLTDSFSYRVFDGTVNSDNVATVNITITNTPPTAVNDLNVAAVSEGGTVNFNVLSNDIDAETGTPVLVAGVFGATNGTATVQPDQSITFTHDDSETSTASFLYTASDGFLTSLNSATVTLIINPENDAPLAVAEAISVDIAGTTTVLQNAATSVLDNDTDPENNTLTAALVTPPLSSAAFTLNSNGTFSYTHDGSDNLSDSFSYRANDGLLNSNTVQVDISVANTRPIGVNDVAAVDEGAAVTINVLANDTDPETGVPTEVSIISNVVNGSVQVNPDQTVTFTHDGGETTTASFEYFPNDNFLDSSRAATVSITVNPVNDAPVAFADAITVDIAGTATQLQDGITTSVLANDTDAENNTLSASLGTSPLHASAFTLNSDGSFSYTHNGSNNLADSFSYRANDGSLNSNLVTVGIAIANTAPIAVNDVASVAEGGSVTINVLANDTDAQTSVPAITSSVSNALNGSIEINSDQSVTFTHDGSETTSASFQYIANDNFLDSPTAATVNLTVTAVNDPPTLAPLTDLVATEAVPMAVLTAEGADVDDANDGVNLTYSLANFPAGMVISNEISTLGQISWTPPQTRQFNQLYGPVIVTVSDGGEDGVEAATRTFSVTVSPPDADADLVPDYDDFCPDVADASNADNDGDGTAGNDADPNDSRGGDLCDTDDDNDGMPDSYESANNLDPFDALDADLDSDGDGVSNLEEFQAGTNPLFETITIDATGLLTPYIFTPPPASRVHPLATVLSTVNRGPFRPGVHEINWVASNATTDNLATSIQLLNVRPLASLSADQTVGEGNPVNIAVSLNGPAATYPVVINYSVSGTADSNDHDATSGSLSINEGETSASFDFNTTVDTQIDADETVIFSIDSVTNAVPGSKKQSTIFIQEGNLAPLVNLKLLQNNVAVSSAFVADGAVTVSADINDANRDQSHQIDWQSTDNALSAPLDLITDAWSFIPSEGVYAIEVVVTDDGQPPRQVRAKRLLRVLASDPPALQVDKDTDGDGINDDAEGYGDLDEDGIADYLDNQAQRHLLQDQTVNPANTKLLQVEPGLKLKTGNTALAAAIAGAAITDATLSSFGGARGEQPLNADDQFEHVSGIYDFEISQLKPGASALMVIPLQIAIPLDARYRKFDAESGWRDFVSDGVRNRLYSARGVDGACPEPGSASYIDGLNHLHSCLQVLIEDGGPNDTDGSANGVIQDPATLGLSLSDPVQPEVEKSGAISLWFMLGLLLMCLVSVRYYRH